MHFWRFKKTAIVMVVLILLSIFLNNNSSLAETASVTVRVRGGMDAEFEYEFDYEDGGQVRMENSDGSNVSFDVPPNFLTEDFKLKGYSYDKSFFEATKPPPADKEFIGKVYDFYIELEGIELDAFLDSLTMVFSYQDSDLGEIDENTLAPYERGDSDSSWVLISGSTLDTVNNTVTFSLSSFSSFALLGSSGSGDGGNGTGDGGVVTGSGGGPLHPFIGTVVFSGKASPFGNLVFLKDGQVVATTETGQNAIFAANPSSGLSPGIYTFGVWGEDIEGRRSRIYTFAIEIIPGITTNVSDIFIPPTIAINKRESSPGDKVNIFGYSAPGADITIIIDSDSEKVLEKKAVSDIFGNWLYIFDTLEVGEGEYSVRAQASKDGVISVFSNIISFKVEKFEVGDVQMEEQLLEESMPATEKFFLTGDINGDTSVNIIDFSIEVPWYKKSSPPPHIDLNNDGRIDLTDFSIMAFYWTG